jgi:hypothetical protein
MPCLIPRSHLLKAILLHDLKLHLNEEVQIGRVLIFSLLPRFYGKVDIPSVQNLGKPLLAFAVILRVHALQNLISRCLPQRPWMTITSNQKTIHAISPRDQHRIEVLFHLPKAPPRSITSLSKRSQRVILTSSNTQPLYLNTP